MYASLPPAHTPHTVYNKKLQLKLRPYTCGAMPDQRTEERTLPHYATFVPKRHPKAAPTSYKDGRLEGTLLVRAQAGTTDGHNHPHITVFVKADDGKEIKVSMHERVLFLAGGPCLV